MKKLLALMALSIAVSVTGCSANNSVSASTSSSYISSSSSVSIASSSSSLIGTSSSSSKSSLSTAPTSSSSATSKVSSSTSKAKPTIELYISAAASLTESLNEIADLYKKTSPEIKLIINYGASGTLQTQIEQGAPTDIFLSAAEKQMNTLNNKGLILTETKKNLLLNKVVMIVPTTSTSDLKNFDDCLTDKVKIIAIGNPESVPVGQYAQEIFTNLNGWDTIKSKYNLASNVKEVLSWTETGNVDCGVVYSTDAATSKGVKIVCEAPTGSHKPVIYPGAVVKASTNQVEAKKFLDYLSSDAAKQVFTKYGFSIA